MCSKKRMRCRVVIKAKTGGIQVQAGSGPPRHAKPYKLLSFILKEKKKIIEEF